MEMLSFRGAAALAGALFLSTAAYASDPPDRSNLSYDENVSVNTACFNAKKQGDRAYDRCVKAQLAALEAHPSPDRSQLSEARNKQIERDCDYLRRVGIGEYNDCLKKGMEGPKPLGEENTGQAAGLQQGLTTNVAKVFMDTAAPPAEKPEKVAAATKLPMPKAVLPKRPNKIDQKQLSAAEIYKKVERSVFVVGAARTVSDARSRNLAQGSAIAISEHLLMTNCHVVADRPLIVVIHDQLSLRATLVAADPPHDRCIIKSEGEALTPIAGIRSFGDLAVGEHVFAIGTPVGLERTLTEGLISGLRPVTGVNLVQTSAPLSPGNSGGGLFDDRGNLIGITTLASRYGLQNLNFAIAASDFWE